MGEKMVKKVEKSKKRILMVDDSHLTSAIMSEYLISKGYEVDIVITGEEAVEYVTSTNALDLILMDIELAGKMSGIDAAREIHKIQEVPVVFFTANASDEIRREIREVKAYGYLMKGMDRTVMLSTIEMAIQLHETYERASMYHHIIENQVNEVYIFRQYDFAVLQTNLCAGRRTGYSKEEWNETSFLKNKPFLTEEDLKNQLDKLLTGEVEQVFIQTTCVKKDQSTYPIEIDFQKIRYNREICFYATVSDLTEKNIMKDQLNNREAMLSAVVNSAQDGMVILDDAGQVVLWNRSAERIFGYENEEILGKSFQDYCAPSERYPANSIQNLICKEMVGRTVEISSRNKAGQDLDLEVSISDFWMGQFRQIIVLVRDISQRKKWQKEIQASRTQYLELAENSPIGIARCDIDGNVEYVNRTGASYFGLEPVDIIGKYNLLREPSLEKSGVVELIRRCIKEHDLVKGEIKCQILDKAVTIRLQVKPLQDSENKEGLQIILDDITEIKSLENELRALSQTDPLTGAYNRRFFMEEAQKEINRINYEKDDTVCFAMMDIDRFKHVNDQYGHRAGDEVLIRVVDLIKKQIGYGDLLTRWGGEEFVILLNHKNLEQSFATLKKIRYEMDQIRYWSKVKVTASFGLAEYKQGESLDSVISRADDYMYEAKSAGRDCIRGEK